MTKRLDNPRAFIVAKRDEYGFPKFAVSGFFTESDAAAMLEPGFEVLRYSDYLKQADSDDLPERKARQRAGFAPVSSKPKTAVVTGTFDKPRAVIVAALKAAGFSVRESLSPVTTHLVTGAEPGGTKLAKAAALGVARVSLSEALGG